MGTTIIISHNGAVRTRSYRKLYHMHKLLQLLSALTGKAVDEHNIMRYGHGPCESVRGQVEEVTFMVILRRAKQ